MTTKKILHSIFLFLFAFSFSFSQTSTDENIRGKFTYLFQAKPNSLNRDYIYKELFSLQISDKRSFFISENKLKFDSLFTKEFAKNNGIINMKGVSSKASNFLIIQTNENVQCYETVGMTLLTYNIPIINNWKLVDETKVINTFVCKKAEIKYKGRDWVAWYSTAIPFPYGPFKFSNLPGLIIKITDKTGDYDFELVKSEPNSSIEGKMITISKRHYYNAKLVTKKELDEARKNFKENARHELESMGTQFSQDQRERHSINEVEKKGYNPIELED